tara:strand:- start:434 stop:1192 length:759 start_codon:yes stop_codon:yes gene_type:complete
MNKILSITVLLLLTACEGENSSNASNSGGGTGQAGSLATFTIAKNNLYVMDTSSVIAFSLTEPTNPQQFDRHTINFSDGETIFNHQNEYVFIGKRTGVDILALDETGEMTFLAEHSHITACDPVIAAGNRSFVTTRAGNGCGFGQNLLEVLDISDMSNPEVIFSLEMRAPNGLAVSGDDLFVCDLSEGLKRFKIVENEDGFFLEQAYISDIYDCNDIILTGDLIILNHDDGITQIQWQGDDFTVLSNLEISR